MSEKGCSHPRGHIKNLLTMLQVLSSQAKDIVSTFQTKGIVVSKWRQVLYFTS
jgi:hypothetical protein